MLRLSGLRHRHVEALQPLLRTLLVLGFQHVRLALGEDLKGAGQAAITPLPGYDLQKRTPCDLWCQSWQRSEVTLTFTLCTLLSSMGTSSSSSFCGGRRQVREQQPCSGSCVGGGTFDLLTFSSS